MSLVVNMLRLAFVLVVTLTAVWGANDGATVKIKNGFVKGSIEISRKGKEFYAFKGIPFAKPPIGNLRFKPPVPEKSWAGIWQADTYHQCLQIDLSPELIRMADPPVEGSEDCLYLNVFTPVKRDRKLLDVIVHIHGGAFMFGHGDLYGANHLIDKDIVYVSLNYRLGPLGFLSTEDSEAPGNNGLKDQVMALKWIKQNIKAFGGNPDSVTLTGMSAGGASVHFHYLSPMSKGLFHRGISASGTALMNWALVEKPLARAKRLGELVGCTSMLNSVLVECLRARPGQQLVRAARQLQPWLSNPYTPFGPVVEPKGVGKRFLEDHPYRLLKKGKVHDLPWITSVTSSEGLFPAAALIYNDEDLPHLEKNWEKLAKHILHFEDTINVKSQAKVAKQIKEEYLKKNPISRKTFPELVQLFGDRLFVVDAEKAARLQAQANKSPVYFYVFGYRGGFSATEYLSNSREDLGVCHADDLMYIAAADKRWFSSYLETKDDNDMCDLLVDMWARYASTGVASMPGTVWDKVTNDDNSFEYLRIVSPTKQHMEKSNNFGRKAFWDSLPFAENQKLFVKDEL